MTRNKKIIYSLAFISYAVLYSYFGYLKFTKPVHNIEPIFIANKDVAYIVVDLIDGAQKSIHIASFNILHREVVKALRRAQERGVDVKVITDVSAITPSYSEIPRLAEKAIPIRFFNGINANGEVLQVMHHKYVVFDEETIITGSNNLSYKGLGTDITKIPHGSVFSETMVIIRNDPPLVKRYLDNWNGLWNKAALYSRSMNP